MRIFLEDATRGDPGTSTGGWIDDIYFFTHSETTEHNCRTLCRMHHKAEKWSSTHGSQFDQRKYQLLHLTRNVSRYNMKEALMLRNITIEQSTPARYLGIMMDQQLRWWPHIRYIQGQATSTLQALRSRAGSTWGSSLVALRHVYLAMVVPQITYGCSVWYTSQGEKGHTAKMCTKLSRIQLEAARIISGAYRATSAGALDVELFILPMRQQLEKNAHNAVINIRSGSMNPSPETYSYIHHHRPRHPQGAGPGPA